MITSMYRSTRLAAHLGRLALALLLLPAALSVASAEVPEPMNLAYTYHAFALAGGGETLIQFDYQFNGHALEHARQGDSYVGKLYLRLSLTDSTGKKALDVDWITSHSQHSEVGDGVVTLMGRKSLALRPGTYRGEIYYEDVNRKSNHDSAEFAMVVPDLAGKRVRTSDVMILADMSPSDDSTDQFYRNGFRMIPNMTSVIAPPFLVLNTYAEVYNADAVPTTEYSVIYALADSSGRVFFRKDLKRPRPSAPAVMETNSLTLEEVPSGEYYLIVQIYDGLLRSARDSSMVLRRFTLINPDKDSVLAAQRIVSGGAQQVVDPSFAGMREEELDQEFTKSKFIASAVEKQLWEQLSGPDAKARFLTNFWEKRDPTPGTAVNEMRREYYKRVDRARAQFTSGMTPNGWDSDRGRILLTYGTPDGIDRHPQDYNRKPYEVWHYNGLNYDFAFVDRNQTGTYMLVHSNAPGEISNEDWENEYARIHQFRNSQGWGD